MVLADRYHFSISSVLGSGLFATVVKAKDIDSGIMCAIKVRQGGGSIGGVCFTK